MQPTRKSLFSLLNAVLLLLIAAGARAQTTLNVPSDFATIQAAIDAAAPGDFIQVAPGTYAESIVWADKDLVIFGAGAGQTIIDPSYVGGCISTYNLTASSFIQGITFQHGFAVFGGGMYNEFSSLTVYKCAFQENGVNYGGGGMDNRNFSSPILANCLFTCNSGPEGGAMFNEYGCNPMLINCTLAGNFAYTTGGAMKNYYANPILINCIIWGNTSTWGAPGIFNDNSSPQISNSDVQGGYPGTGNFDADPIFGRNSDFSTGDLGDLKLQPGSPCLNVGDSSVVSTPPFITDATNTFAIDLGGHPRIIDGVVDLGAWEGAYVPAVNRAPIANAGNDQTVEATGPTTPVTLDGSLSSDPDGDALTYQWSEGGTALGTGASVTVDLPLGQHTITLTVTDTQGANNSDDVVVNVQDTIKPTLSWGTATPAPNAAGWNNTPVDIPFTADDSGSGVASVSPASPLHFGSEGAGQTQDVTVTDNAGNSKTYTSPAVKIDMTAPTSNASATGTTTSTVTISASDNLSGVKATYYSLDGGPQQTYTGQFTVSQGLHQVQYWSVDNAGNQEPTRYLAVDTRYAVTVVVANVSGKRGMKASLSATVTRTSNGAKISGKAVTFSVTPGLFGNAVTNSKGVATLSITIPTTFATGAHTIGATAQPDGTYKSGYGAGTLTVK